MPRKKSRKGSKKTVRKRRVTKRKGENLGIEIGKPVSGRRRKRKAFPCFATIFCGCMLLGMCGLLLVGLLWWLNNARSGPIYSRKPIVHITGPTGNNWYSSDDSSVTISGVASDTQESIRKVTWEIEGGKSGDVTGTSSWQTEGISLSEGDNKITIKAYDVWGNVGEDSISVVYNKEINFRGELELSYDSLFKDDLPVDITVRASIASSDQSISSVKLYEVDYEGKILREKGEMKDSGKVKDGDDIPGDGTYSFKGSFASSSGDPIFLRAVAKSDDSNASGFSTVGKLEVVEHIDMEDLELIENLNQKVSDLVDNLQDQGTAQKEIAKEVNNLLSREAGIEAYGISEQGQGVWWVFENTCVPGGVILNPPDTRGGEGEGSLQVIGRANLFNHIPTKVNAQNRSLEVLNTQAIYLGPYLDQFGETDDYYGAWEKIEARTCPRCETFEKKNKEVTVEDFKNLDQYGLIVISSHGDNWYGGLKRNSKCFEGLEQSQVVILTSQDATEESIERYEADLVNRRLAIGASGNFIILPSFISHYNLRFPNSLVYVGTCRSAYNNTMAAAFLGKGASGYLGFDGYVLSSFSHDIGKELFSNFVINDFDVRTSFLDAVEKTGTEYDSDANLIFYGEDSLLIGGRSWQNGGFEEGDLAGWVSGGDSRVIPSLGLLTSTEGEFLAILSTGLGSVKDSTSSISQKICLEEGVGTLLFDYNLISEEPPEYMNSFYDDKLEISISIDGQAVQTLTKGISDSEWKKIDGINFAGGDDTTYETGWQIFSYSLEDIGTELSIELKIEISDVGDSAFDTAVLIDNVRVE